MTSDDATLYAFVGYELALKSCEAFGQLAKPGTVGYCISHGGGGKSSIAKQLGRLVFGEPGTWRVGCVPYIYVEADLADRAYFSHKDLMRSLLCEVHDPFRSRTDEIMSWNLPDDYKRNLIDALGSIRPLKSSESEMRHVFVNIARLLGVKLLIIDEANLLVLTQQRRVNRPGFPSHLQAR